MLSRGCTTEPHLQELTADFPDAFESRGLLIFTGCCSLPVSRKIEEASHPLVELPGKGGLWKPWGTGSDLLGRRWVLCM